MNAAIVPHATRPVPDKRKEDRKIDPHVLERKTRLELAFQPPTTTTGSTISGWQPQGKRVAVILSYINCKNKDAVIGVLRKFFISQSTAVGQALSYYALTQLELLTVKSDKEFSVGLVKEFGDIPTIKSEHSIRQALRLLRKEQYVTVNQKMCSGRLLDSDEIAPVLQRLKAEIKVVLTVNQQQ